MTLNSEQKASLITILGRLETALRYGGEAERADFIADIVSTISGGKDLDMASLAGPIFWGGSGSFIDLRMNPPDDESESQQDDRPNYIRAMKALLEEIHSLGHLVYHDEFNSRFLKNVKPV